MGTDGLSILVLLLLYQVKHFICDYPLQNEYMLGKMKKVGWVLPLLTHASVHALGTLFILSIFTEVSWLWVGILTIFDGVVHFSIDRIKASPSLLNRFKTDNKFFWWSLGLDQMLHHLTHYIIIFMGVYFVTN